jgi:hypothetical protein
MEIGLSVVWRKAGVGDDTSLTLWHFTAKDWYSDAVAAYFRQIQLVDKVKSVLMFVSSWLFAPSNFNSIWGRLKQLPRVASAV